MHVCQFIYHPETGWHHQHGEDIVPDLLLAFGSGKDCSGETIVSWRKKHFPEATLIGCSTAGEIICTQIHTNTIAVTGIKFDKTSTLADAINIADYEDSFQAGQALADTLPHKNLRHCFVLSDGLNVNGTKLVEGLESKLPDSVNITGGLAGDGKRFETTQVCVNDQYGSHLVAILGIYGDNIAIRCGSYGGWSTFGPDRLISKSTDNVLYELDGKSALSLYKDYLGEYAKNLPSSGLLFPLQITTPDGKEFARTLLAIDNEQDSMTFAGDIPQGSFAKLMRANVENLIDGASEAASATLEGEDGSQPELAILISCVGRRLVLAQRAEEEIEAVSELYENQVPITGFYSYGEICPLHTGESGTLHNQTMTITTLKEV